MAKPLRSLFIALFLIALLGVGAWWLLAQPSKSEADSQPQYLLQKQMSEVASVTVENQNGSYTVTQTENGATVQDIPAPLVNLEYVAMLLDECSSVCYTQEVEQTPKELAPYGLDAPVSKVDIAYTDGTSLRLLFGAPEPVSGGRYFKTANSDRVLLMQDNRTIRFTMPVERYINYIIIEPNSSPSILSAVQDITFSGSQLPQPIALKAVLEGREELLRTAASFGAVTHLIVQPQLQEVNQTELIRLTESLLGLISEGIVAYNCTPQQLAEYGFDQPVLQVEFDYQNGKDAPVKHHILKLSTLDGGYIATLDDWGVVYKIAPVDFTTVSYDALVQRWFLSPFLTDVRQLEVTLGDTRHRFALEGDTAKELSVTLDRNPVDSELFRKYYNLVVSAAASEPLPTGTVPQGSPLATICFAYKDAQKADDVLRLYEGAERRLIVEVNGVCGFVMRDKYLPALQEATKNLANNQTFSTDW